MQRLMKKYDQAAIVVEQIATIQRLGYDSRMLKLKNQFGLIDLVMESATDPPKSPKAFERQVQIASAQESLRNQNYESTKQYERRVGTIDLENTWSKPIQRESFKIYKIKRKQKPMLEVTGQQKLKISGEDYLISDVERFKLEDEARR